MKARQETLSWSVEDLVETDKGLCAAQKDLSVGGGAGKEGKGTSPSFHKSDPRSTFTNGSLQGPLYPTIPTRRLRTPITKTLHLISQSPD